MASQSLSNRPDFQAKLPRTDHNVGHSMVFTSSVGHLLPVFNQFMNVGESIYFTPNLFSRTQPMLNAAMADVDVYLDTFFVPMQMLFTAWDSLRYQTNDPISSLWSARMNSTLPFPDFNLLSSCYPLGVEDFASSREDFITEQLTDTNYNQLEYDSEFDCRGKEMLRLFDLLRLPRSYAFFNSSTYPQGDETSDVRSFYPALLAYQCIFENHYRLEDWERKNVESYNIDNPYVAASGVAANIKVPYATFIHYRPWHMDSFTSLKNGPLASFVNLVGGTSVSSSNVLQNLVNYLQPGITPLSFHIDNGATLVSPLNDNTTVVNNQTHTSAFNTSALRTSTASLRSIFAYEKLVRIFGRTAKDYDSQVLAHFGFKVPHDVKHQISYLGTSKGILHIGEVVSTSDTQSESGGAALGSIAGKGYVSIKGKRIKFTAPTDGIFMCIYSAVPRVLYTNTLDKVNLMSQSSDLYNPEYDKLGMQPMYSWERRDNDLTPTRVSSRLGWQFRYEQYKRKPNVATLAFSSLFDVHTGIRNVNMYSSWIIARGNTQDDVMPSKAIFHYCPPTALNNLMVVPYVTGVTDEQISKPYLIFQTDPFINDIRFDAKLVSTMSRFGEPELD